MSMPIICPMCGVYHPAGALVCGCGYDFSSKTGGARWNKELDWVKGCQLGLGCLVLPFAIVIGVIEVLSRFVSLDTLGKIIQEVFK